MLEAVSTHTHTHTGLEVAQTHKHARARSHTLSPTQGLKAAHTHAHTHEAAHTITHARACEQITVEELRAREAKGKDIYGNKVLFFSLSNI